jgi:azurin
VVVSATTDVSAISMAGMKAGAGANYLPKGDARVLASTPLVGGGGKTAAKFAGSKLKAGGDYSFFCSFPGHSGIMKGKLVVTK